MQVAMRSGGLIVTYTMRAERGNIKGGVRGGGALRGCTHGTSAGGGIRVVYVADTTDEETRCARERATGLVDPWWIRGGRPAAEPSWTNFPKRTGANPRRPLSLSLSSPRVCGTRTRIHARHATLRHAAPRHATPRHTTSRHATARTSDQLETRKVSWYSWPSEQDTFACARSFNFTRSRADGIWNFGDCERRREALRPRLWRTDHCRWYSEDLKTNLWEIWWTMKGNTWRSYWY